MWQVYLTWKNKYCTKGNKGGVCSCLHLLIGEFMSADCAGFFIEILLCIHHHLRSVLMLVNADVLSPDAAPNRPPQFCLTDIPTTHSESTEFTLIIHS